MSVQGGSTFSEALAQQPKIVDRLFVNMVKAGELGGVLEVVLNRLEMCIRDRAYSRAAAEKNHHPVNWCG